MKKAKQIGSMLVILGIGWIWLISVIWTFIEIDGWILYPIAFTSVFLMLCATIHILLKIDDLYDCQSCGIWFDKQKDTPFVVRRDYDPNELYCPSCAKKSDLENQLSKKDKRKFEDRLRTLEISEEKRKLASKQAEVPVPAEDIVEP